ncbi:hypothetical protein [Ruegeria lacuscaerulensis]|uniref:hypothetical protein n=1 Tax=Ruegeria lacuscaerulensis TaxID=55218 RepID=UPI00147CB04D|nr:hypothetical protein [Ruegeria lacuscaerulensis]
MKLLCFVSLSIVFLSVLRAFSGLEHASLWTDELFTAYFADPKLANFDNLLARATEDGHPPGYYIILWTVLRLVDGEFVTVARGFSAITATIALVLVYLAPLPTVRWQARLVSLAVAVTSLNWWYFADEARSYGFVYCLVAIAILTGLRCRRSFSNNLPFAVWLSSLTVTSILTVFIHYYSILLSGAIFGVLLLSCTKWSQRVLVTCSGFAVLVFAVCLVIWHMPKIVVDVQNTWFEASVPFILEHIARGVNISGSPMVVAIFVLLMCLITILIVKSWDLASLKSTLTPDLSAGVLFLFSVIALTIVLGIIVSVLFVPVFSFRLFLIFAPILWVSVAYFMEWICRMISLRDTPPVLEITTTLALSTALIIVTAHNMIGSTPLKEPWKRSARYIASLDSCSSSKIPISWFEQKHFSEDDPERFYGFYLEPNAQREWLKIPRQQSNIASEMLALKNHVLRVAGDPETCPVLFWSIHFFKDERLAEMKTFLDETLKSNGHGEMWVEVLFSKKGSYSALMMLASESNSHLKSVCSPPNTDTVCQHWFES